MSFFWLKYRVGPPQDKLRVPPKSNEYLGQRDQEGQEDFSKKDPPKIFKKKDPPKIFKKKYKSEFHGNEEMEPEK